MDNKLIIGGTPVPLSEVKNQVGEYDIIMNPGGTAFIESGAADGNANAPKASMTTPGNIVFSGGTSTGDNAINRTVYEQSKPIAGGNTVLTPVGSSTGVVPTGTITRDITVTPAVNLNANNTIVEKAKVEPPEIPKGSTFVDANNDGFDDKTGLNSEGKTKKEVIDSKIESKGSDESLIKPFSWLEQSKDTAQIQAEQNILKAEQNALYSRQEIMQQGEESAQMTDMQKYVLAQSAEKAGWTGGYRLDQTRQLDYLKASVQASMFNAQEMQRYGFDSQLQAARLAYEQGKQQLALEYYNTAVTQAMNEAQITGVYFSPEQKDMLKQYRAAELILENASPDSTTWTAEQNKAAQIINTLEDWFKTNGLSKQGIETLAKLSLQNESMIAQQSKLTAALSYVNDLEDGSVPLRDSNGNYIWEADGNTLKTFNPNTASNQELFDYFSGNLVVDGVNVSSGAGLFKSKINTLGQSAISNWFSSLSDADKKLSATELQNKLTTYLSQSGNPISNYITTIENATGKQFDLKKLLDVDNSGNIQILNVSGGKNFKVTFNTRTNNFEVVKQGTTLVNGLQTANSWDEFKSLNPNYTFYQQSNSSNLPITLSDRNSINKNALNANEIGYKNEEALVNDNYTKVFTDTFYWNQNPYVYNYYAKIIDGKVKLLRWQTNK